MVIMAIIRMKKNYEDHYESMFWDDEDVEMISIFRVQGLLDVPVHQRPAESPSPRLPTQSPLDLPAARQLEPV